MPSEDPIAASLRALTGVEWRKRKDLFEARINHTHMEGIALELGDHKIAVHAELSEARSGRYIATVNATETANILKAMAVTKAVIKPHRRKRNS